MRFAVTLVGALKLAGDTRLSFDRGAQLGRLCLRVSVAQVGLRRRASSGLDPSDSPARTALTEAEECLREHSGTRTTVESMKWGCMDRWRSHKIEFGADQPSVTKASGTGDPLEASCHLGLVEHMESRGVKTAVAVRL